jgi:ATP/maltotriose-dependent transcriptional regulator MalT
LNTVKTHPKNIYLKLEVDNRAKAVAKARELRMV